MAADNIRRISAGAVLLLALALVCSWVSAGCDSSERSPDDGDRTASGVERATLPEWGDPQGRWHEHGWLEVPLEEERDLTLEQRREFARLRSLGYLPGSSPMPANTGVIVYDGERVYDGLNFYTSGHAPAAFLIDMSGRRVHEWSLGFARAWMLEPGDDPPRSIKGAGYWRRAHLFENGDVVAIFEGLGLIKVDKDSELLWARFGGFHHDLEVTEDGRIYVLTREPRIIPRIHAEMPVLEDFVVVLDPDGNELERVSVLEALERSVRADLLDGMGESGDVFHTNTLELLDGRLAGVVDGFDAGNVLVCIRELSVLAVLDMERGTAVWGMDGGWGKPHQSTVLPNGNVLLFDNRGNRGRSQVIEFDPATFETRWSYRGAEPDDFYSWECGSNQRLPNGNTLITESDRGKAFEVTPDGTIVWKYLNPMRAGHELEFIATLFELVRLPPDFPLDWLDGGMGT